MIATGWLIEDDIVATAGHCLYDHGSDEKKGMGCVTRIKAYIGYHGKRFVNDDDVQFRAGSSAVTPAKWLDSKMNKSFDVGFIQLTEAFDGVNRLPFIDTPVQGKTILGVVGYPGDKSVKGEIGAEMYEMFQEETYNIEKSERHMLEYKIATYWGEWQLLANLLVFFADIC